jgi:hypothetical protein
MQMNYKLPILIISFLAFALVSHCFAQPASAARFLFSPSTGTLAGTTQLEIRIDTENAAVESAVAVVTYNSNHVNIVGITAGDFFDDVSSDATVTGEIAITGTLSQEKTSGVTGSGKLATITISPKITSGTISLAFRCSSTEADDSNILAINSGENLLETNEQCARNIAGSYTVGATTTTPTPTTTPAATTKGDQPVAPETLPQAGPMNWLKWLTSGLALIGIGLLLL